MWSENAKSWRVTSSAAVEVTIVDAASDSAATSPMPLAWTWVQAESLDMGLWWRATRGMEGKRGHELASQVGGIEPTPRSKLLTRPKKGGKRKKENVSLRRPSAEHHVTVAQERENLC